MLTPTVFTSTEHSHAVQEANEICGKPVTKLPPVKSKDGKTLENTEEIHGRLKEHFEELYNFITYKIQSTKTF